MHVRSSCDLRDALRSSCDLRDALSFLSFVLKGERGEFNLQGHHREVKGDGSDLR